MSKSNEYSVTEAAALMASGKLTREVVNIEGGSISLVTSNDPTMVAKLYTMAGLSPGQKVVKS